MAWHSILPASISFVETWTTRICILLAVLVIAPWLLLIVYDIVLFTCRTVTYEVPVVGGRARNRPRPRAPSISQRPNGRPRTFSVGLPNLEGVSEISLEGVKDAVQDAVEKTIVGGMEGKGIQGVAGMGDVNDGSSGQGMGANRGVEDRLKKMGYDNAVSDE